MGRLQRADRHRAQALPKRKVKTQTEIEELREENRRLRRTRSPSVQARAGSNY